MQEEAGSHHLARAGLLLTLELIFKKSYGAGDADRLVE